MKIGAYFHTSRIGLPTGDGRFRIAPTGVGKHTVHMLLGLAAMPDVQLTAVLPQEDLDESGKIPAVLPLASLPVAALPYSRRFLETSWSIFNAPKVDRWCGGCDWIYCPQEAVVATREASLAVTVHDIYPLEPHHRWRNWRARAKGRFRWSLQYGAIRRQARLVLAVSEFTKSRLVDLLDYDPNRIVVVGNAVDDIFFDEPAASAETDGLLPAGPYVLVVGGLARKKGGDYLLNVARKLEEVRPEIRIVVCGVSESPYKEQAGEMGNIIRLGYEPVERHIRLLRGAGALLMLSRYEGFGIPAVEAMAAGTPAIVSRFASLPEVVGEGGLVVDAERAQDVVEMIEKVVDDERFRVEVIGKGRKRAEQFRRGAVAGRLYNAMKNAVAR